MKRDLNLMVKRPTDAKAAKGILFVLLLLVILGALYYFGTSIPNGMKTAALLQKTDLDTQLTVLSKAKEKFDAGTKAKAQMMNAINLVNELEGNKKDMPVLFDFIEKACPPKITLYAVKFAPDSIGLSGYAENDLQISGFLVGLRKNTDFKTVVVTSSIADTEKKRQDFSVSIDYAAPLKAEPVTVPEESPAANAAGGQSPQNTKDAQATASPTAEPIGTK